MPARKGTAARPKPRPKKRETAHLFDLLFKRFLHISPRAIVSFINGLFGAKHPVTAKVEHLPTESVSGKLRQLQSDNILRIDGSAEYLIETEIRHGEDMVIRVFEYGLARGLAQKTYDKDGVRTVKFPAAAVIFWETGENVTEAPQTLRLQFPDGSSYDYKAETFNLLAHSVAELERRGLAILLPFCILKLRRQVKAAKTSAKRQKLAAAMRRLLEELAGALEGSRKAKVIEDADYEELIASLDHMYDELYGQYKELAKEETVFKYFKVKNGMIMLPTDEAEERGVKKASLKIARSMLAEGDSPEKVARNTGLTLRKVNSLLKPAKTKANA